jgi:hypothetical protein
MELTTGAILRRITETHYMRMGWRRVFPHGGPIIDA